jgi:hypothetical protein
MLAIARGGHGARQGGHVHPGRQGGDRPAYAPDQSAMSWQDFQRLMPAGAVHGHDARDHGDAAVHRQGPHFTS